MLGPHVSIYAVSHPIDPEIRGTDLEISAPVTIGEGSVIGSGSVVTHDIPARVVAAGNPCRVIREIGEADRKLWEAEYEDYRRQFEASSEKHDE